MAEHRFVEPITVVQFRHEVPIIWTVSWVGFSGRLLISVNVGSNPTRSTNQWYIQIMRIWCRGNLSPCQGEFTSSILVIRSKFSSWQIITTCYYNNIGTAAQTADGRRAVNPLHRNGVGSNPTRPTKIYCGVEKWSSRQSHKLEIVGSNPTLPQPKL